MSSAEEVFLPIHPPPTTYKDDPRAVLSKSEQTMYDEVLAHFTRSDPAYSLPNFEKGELTDQEKFWLSRESLLRYLRATKWKVSAAIERLESTLVWRREFGVYDVVSASHVEPEAVTGKEILYGYDVTGKPACYMIPSRQNTSEPTRQIQFAVWMLERSIDLMAPGVETLALLINFGDRGKNPSVSTALSVLHILQNHYPERLGLALIINVPFFVNAFFKIVMPFVDPITRQKVKFNPEIFKDGFFAKEMVMKEWAGSSNFKYEHEKYWPDLVSTCEERVQQWNQNWRKLGGKVGISEWAYKQTVEPAAPLSQVDTKDKEVVTVVTAAASESEVTVASVASPSPPQLKAIEAETKQDSEKVTDSAVATETKKDKAVLEQAPQESVGNATESHTGTSVGTASAAGAVGGGATSDAGGSAADGGE